MLKKFKNELKDFSKHNFWRYTLIGFNLIWICCSGRRNCNLLHFSKRDFQLIITGSFRVSLFIDLGFLWDLGTGWRGALGTFMISRKGSYWWGNLTFGMGWWGNTQSASSLGNGSGNASGKALGNAKHIIISHFFFKFKQQGNANMGDVCILLENSVLMFCDEFPYFNKTLCMKLRN